MTFSRCSQLRDNVQALMSYSFSINVIVKDAGVNLALHHWVPHWASRPGKAASQRVSYVSLLTDETGPTWSETFGPCTHPPIMLSHWRRCHGDAVAAV